MTILTRLLGTGEIRQTLALTDIQQLSETELRAVIRNGQCAELAWIELKKRRDAVRNFDRLLGRTQ